MKRSKVRRVVLGMSSLLLLAIVGFLAVGLLNQDSWAGLMLQGAGVVIEGEPVVFPSDDLVFDASVPQAQTPANEALDTAITFEGLLGGGCPAWGTDPAHLDGARYYAGTFDLEVGGSRVQGYSLDLQHGISRQDAYRANVYASQEPALCAAQWIVTNYSQDQPRLDLSNAEEGVAIQVAIWNVMEGFEPVWDLDAWCGRQAVYDRAVEIMAAAQGHCFLMPASLDLTAQTEQLAPGQEVELTAGVYDQAGRPLAGQAVVFDASLGSTGTASGVSNAQGQVSSSLFSADAGTARVSASVKGFIPVAVADPLEQPKPRLLIVQAAPYSVQDTVEITWAGSAAVVLTSFVASWTSAADSVGEGVLLRWVTASEAGSPVFNLYRGTTAQGPWTLLNRSPIPSQVPVGGQGGASYEWLDSQARPGQPYFFLLEDVAAGTATQHGPVSP